MKSLILGVTAAAAILTAAATPSLAQHLYVGPGGVSAGVGPGYDRDDWYRHRGERFFYGHRGFYGRGDCRNITITKRLPDGSVVTRNRRDCD